MPSPFGRKPESAAGFESRCFTRDDIDGKKVDEKE
jgi:hypothetical protein